MTGEQNRFLQLAGAVATGDVLAEAKLRSELEGALVHVIRQTLRAEGANTAVARRIRAAARKMTCQRAAAAMEHDDIVPSVARHVCNAILAKVRSCRLAGIQEETIVGS